MVNINKANLRDLIAATELVILLKLDSNHRFFSLCELGIWWMTWKNYRAPLLYYIKLCASFYSHQWFETRVSRKRSIRVKISDFFVPCDLEIWQMTLKNNRAPILCCFKLCASFHSHQSIQTGVTVRTCPIRVKISIFFVPCDLEISEMTLRNNRAPLLCCFKLCASFHSHQSIQTGVTVRKRPNWGQNWRFF